MLLNRACRTSCDSGRTSAFDALQRSTPLEGKTVGHSPDISLNRKCPCLFRWLNWHYVSPLADLL